MGCYAAGAPHREGDGGCRSHARGEQAVVDWGGGKSSFLFVSFAEKFLMNFEHAKTVEAYKYFQIELGDPCKSGNIRLFTT